MKNISLKKTFKKIRSVCTFWIAEQSLDHLKAIRLHEINLILKMLPPEGKILEIGAGTGWQAEVLERNGYNVHAIDLPASSIYKDKRVRFIKEYDGKTIPYADHSFDVVFSSNVLMHIPHVHDFQKEILRVLKPDGSAIHVLPTSSWRLWSNLTHLLKFWANSPILGEHAGNAWTEIYYLSGRWWTRLFRQTRWTVMARTPTKLFYTGSSIMDSRLTIKARKQLKYVFGSSSTIFVLKKS